MAASVGTVTSYANAVHSPYKKPAARQRACGRFDHTEGTSSSLAAAQLAISCEHQALVIADEGEEIDEGLCILFFLNLLGYRSVQ